MDVDTIWKNGEYLDWEDATTHVLTHALHYGSGVFEGVRCYDTEQGPAIFRWEEHLDRLFDSAKMYDMEIEYSREEITEATLELLDRQDLDSAYIRPLAYFGYDSLGVSPKDCPTDLVLAAWPWGAYLGEEALEEGVDVMVSSWRKHASSQVPTNVKTTGLYVNSMLAGEEARRNGYVEAIVLNKEGNVAEGPGENIFMVNDGDLHHRSRTVDPRRDHPRHRHRTGEGARLHRPRRGGHLPRTAVHRRRAVLHRLRRRGDSDPLRR